MPNDAECLTEGDFSLEEDDLLVEHGCLVEDECLTRYERQLEDECLLERDCPAESGLAEYGCLDRDCEGHSLAEGDRPELDHRQVEDDRLSQFHRLEKYRRLGVPFRGHLMMLLTKKV